MASILIVDDEVLIAEQLERGIIKSGHASAGIATTYDEAMELLETQKPDLILLDIRLYGSLSGLDIAEVVNEKFKIPFVYLTSHLDAQTLERAKLSRPAGYLSKPFQMDSVYTTIEVALFNNSNVNQDPELYVDIIEGGKTHRLPIGDIVYMESDHVYSKIVMVDSELLVRRSLSELAEELPKEYFLRTHRRYIANLHKVERMASESIVLNGATIPVGRTFKEQVIRVIGSRSASKSDGQLG